jgi:hypothetical protein
MNRGLELDGLTGGEVVKRDPTVADADFVLVEEVEIETRCEIFFVPQARGAGFRSAISCALCRSTGHRAHFERSNLAYNSHTECQTLAGTWRTRNR